ncbi:WD40 repeat-like protein [Lactarius indigo]|nr:WD40 repeat-like protein [Lactarius indigo]
MENELTFVAPEGVYSVTEDHKPLPITHNAPAPIFPTRLSSITVRFPAPKQPATPGLGQLLGGGKDFWKEKGLTPGPAREDGVSVSSGETPEDATPPDVGSSQDVAPPTSMGSQDQNHGLFSPPTGGKRRASSHPKHNMRTTSSTFITRVQAIEGLAKTLQSKQGEATYLFYNSSKNLYWVEAGVKAKEALVRVAFATHPTCHDVNHATASHEHLDLIIGFQTGDLIWLDPFSLRYGRLNKQGRISNSPCTAVRWVPSSPNLFLVSHADGTIIVYDKDRDDGVFTAQPPTSSPVSSLRPPSNGPSSYFPGEWNPLDSIFVTNSPMASCQCDKVPQEGAGEGDRDKATKNPVSHWKVSKRSVVDFVFSPDVKYVAAISEDGLSTGHRLHWQNSILVDCYAAYFGSLTCVAWSPDGRFIITGGQDDLVNIFSPWEQRVIARCQGHSSFLSALAFDDLRCDGRTYRFGSVGEDNKLIPHQFSSADLSATQWDFSSGILHRPKLHSHHHRLSMASSLSLGARRRGDTLTADHSTLHLPPLGAEGPLPRYHPAPSRNEVAIVQPVLVKQLENDILTAIAFLPRWLLTGTRVGHVKMWIRPLPATSRKNGHASRAATDAQDLDWVS